MTLVLEEENFRSLVYKRPAPSSAPAAAAAAPRMMVLVVEDIPLLPEALPDPVEPLEVPLEAVLLVTGALV